MNVPLRLAPAPVADELLFAAREIVAAVFEDSPDETSQRCAAIARAGGYDRDDEMKIALAAIRFGERRLSC